ncbi:class I SAM-dependent methyltransferase [Bradyrhizobium diazoefficiens]|nr:class I SAM-dependent methyltransferase [Bradyrhizobium diazoefficiens]MBR0962705.1 class I SAM-dependent methyltransferase [Bradyrhizobium diazoefficiens]MBR0976865.1 class I SAM-dependent methyltransferase [Bradyrhizobium diazoefficiens]MBR1005510.1 class I SAM-dependent methyltransferase [Bradyrhizobium diazoefficiens]MBR1011983.1 class I SAM-dependent methyltransferase [Bradyrhizobium diazoefficiens]MBR1049324.1 class I SAM-dependent methyltransferase [Bradyrhizobium diazoefficiens]
MSNDTRSIPEWPQFSSEVMRQGPAIRKAHMASLVRHLKEKHGVQTVNILEVGSWAGASTITWAKAIKDLGLSGSVHCVDIWEPYFDLEANKAEIYEEMNRAADKGGIFLEFQRNIAAAGVADIVTVTKGNSRDVLPRLTRSFYQIVFLDASHLYADIYNDITQAKELVADQGLLCGDDYELPASSADREAHRQALLSNVDFANDPASGLNYHPGVSQALADTLGTVSAWDGLWAVQRRGAGFEKIDRLDYEPHIPEHLRPGDTPAVAEIARSELGFNIIRSQGRYVACRRSLGPVDFSLPLDTLVQSYASSDLFLAPTLEDALVDLCNLTIGEIRSKLDDTGSIQLVESHLGFNIVYCRGRYAGCRQSLGAVDFTRSPQDLSKLYSTDDLFFDSSREKVLLRICEIEKARLSRLIAERSETAAIEAAR